MTTRPLRSEYAANVLLLDRARAARQQQAVATTPRPAPLRRGRLSPVEAVLGACGVLAFSVALVAATIGAVAQVDALITVAGVAFLSGCGLVGTLVLAGRGGR